MSSWERGYGDMVLVPDLDTLRPVPWQEGTVVCLADVAWPDGSDVLASPRQILRGQLARLAERGWSANAGTELEFLVFLDTYEQAWQQALRDLRPANLYNVDYSLLGTARVEPLIRRIRNSMAAAGMVVRGLQGRVQLRPARDQLPLRGRAAHGRRARDLQERRQGDRRARRAWRSRSWPSSTSARATRATSTSRSPTSEGPLFAREERPVRVVPRRAARVPARDDAAARAAHQLLQALCAAARSRPTAVAWGHDNRTCSLRVVGHGPSLRFENRVGGADLNPYLALSAIIASGLHGIERGLELEPALEGNAYAAHERPRLPRTLRDARELFAASDGRARGLRRGRARPLPQRRRRGARGVRLGGDRLGARAGIRAAVMACAAGGRWRAALSSRAAVGHAHAPRRRCSRPCARRPRSRRRSSGWARHQARPARARLAAAGRARAVRAARDRALDAAPGAHRAEPERARVRHARARRRNVRLRPPAADRCRPRSQMLAQWRETCDRRLAVELGVAVLAAERAERAELDALDEVADGARGGARGLRRLPPGGHPPARRARRGHALAGAGAGDDRGAGRDERPDRLHRPSAAGARVLQRSAPAPARRGARGRRDARGTGDERAPAGHRAHPRRACCPTPDPRGAHGPETRLDSCRA